MTPSQRRTILRNFVSTNLLCFSVLLFGPAPELGNVTASIKAIYHEKSFVQSTSTLPDNTTFGILLDRTSFYAESGGQEYDTGNIVIDGVADFQVTNVQVFSGYVLHIGHLKYGQLEVGNEVLSCYDEVRSISFLNFLPNIAAAPTLATAQQPHRNTHSQLLSPRSTWRSHRSARLFGGTHQTTI